MNTILSTLTENVMQVITWQNLPTEETILPLALLTGWMLDIVCGDPANLPHPIVWFGKWISFCEKHLNHGSHRILKGATVTIASIGGTFTITYFIQHLLLCLVSDNNIASLILLYLFLSLVVFLCLSGHTLRKEVRQVFIALDSSLDDGRRQVSRIVGRDTQQLSDNEVRTAALETLAENLSDGVVAPLFWLCLLGAPGMLTYKMVNTLDSMIGYRNERYEKFGRWAARTDDIANYIPARITALLMIAAVYITKNKKNTIHHHSLPAFLIHYGPRHASPNSGWPEAALAGILDCRFGGPHDYFGETLDKPYIGSNPRNLNTNDMRISICVCFITECICIAISATILYFL